MYPNAAIPPFRALQTARILAFSFCICTGLSGSLPALEPKNLPAPVRSTLALLTENSPAAAIEPLKLVGEPLFSIKIPESGHSREWILDRSGFPLSIQTFEPELPHPVLQLLKQELAAGNSLEGLSRSFEAGETVYDLDLRSAKGQHTLAVHASGEILSLEIALSELPGTIQKALLRLSAAGKPEKYFRSEEENNVFFTVGIAATETALWVTFKADGSLLEQEETVPWNALPPPVQRAIQERLSSRERIRVTRKTADRDLTFDVSVFVAGKFEGFSVSSTGTVSELRP